MTTAPFSPFEQAATDGLQGGKQVNKQASTQASKIASKQASTQVNKQQQNANTVLLNQRLKMMIVPPPGWPKFGPIGPCLAELNPNLVGYMPSLADLSTCRAPDGRFRTHYCRSWANVCKCGRCREKLDRNRASFGRCRQIWPIPGQA